MSHEPNAAIRAVKQAFLPTELAAERMAASGLRCIATMIEERRRLRLPLDTGEEALALLREVATDSLTQLDKLYAAHRLMAAIPAQVGLDEQAFGDTGCGDNEPRIFTGATLRVA